jgi:hypothetical protein
MAEPCHSQESAHYYQSAGTKEMAELLQKIYREQDVKTDPSKDGERATALRIELAGKTQRGRTSITTVGSTFSSGMKQRGRRSLPRSASITIMAEPLRKREQRTGSRTWDS